MRTDVVKGYDFSNAMTRRDYSNLYLALIRTLLVEYHQILNARTKIDIKGIMKVLPTQEETQCICGQFNMSGKQDEPTLIEPNNHELYLLSEIVRNCSALVRCIASRKAAALAKRDAK